MANNLTEYKDQKSIDVKNESDNSNYYKQPGNNSNHGMTKWIVLLIVGFVTFFYGVMATGNNVLFKIPFVLLPLS